MKLGLNLSFAVKRWLEPEILAAMCKDDFGVSNVQFTFDLIDPWWPDQARDIITASYRKAFESKGLSIDAAFGGLASYTYAQFLAPFAEQRAIALQFFKRAVDMTLALGAKVMGTPVGGMSNRDANDPGRRAELYASMVGQVKELAAYGREKGLEEIHIEATPLITEFPHSPTASVKLMDDLADSAIPIKLLIDWGHALYQPLLGREADMDLWFEKCGPYIGSIHLQQTDGQLDRHWDFTKEGLVTGEMIRRATEMAGLGDIPQYLEVVTAFESPDEEVYAGLKKSMDYLHRTLN